MGFKERSFSEPVYEAETEEPTKVIIISCEGSNTEPEYFTAIKDILSEHISSLIEIELVEKEDGPSEPQDVLDNLQSYVEKYDFSKDHDSLWLVCDREKVIDRKTGSKGLLEVIPICEEKGYSMALTNPLFEFWLLMHIADISKYCTKILYENDKVNASRRYIDKELSNILEGNGGYSKKSGKFNRRIVTIDNIKMAIEQEKNFENNLHKIVDNLGSNVSSLVTEILEIDT
ncbi:RloB family protein [Vibrio renipiscarius]|uniref:RloB family protein n=1 Tax=Vibrio renipiscarius TaxID=1461322 RepID=UPI00354F9704